MGLGYVGLPLAQLVQRKGYSVTGIDTDPAKIAAMDDLPVASSFESVKSAGIVIICVPTPVYADKLPNLEPVTGAATSVGKHLAKGTLVVLESTVNPGVTEAVVIPVLEEQSGLTAGQDFTVAHCPERINPGDAKWHVGTIPRVVGASTEAGLARAVEFYQSIIEADIYPMASLKEAEAVKIVENSFRDINIAFVNELAISFAKMDIDVVNVINGAATKPFAFMAHYPGIGVGGHCIPVDPYYLINRAKQNGFDHDFLQLARRINSHMPEYAVALTTDGLNELGLALNGAHIALLGLSYKPGVGDLREAPAFTLIDLLEKKGARITAYDPYIAKDAALSEYHEHARHHKHDGTLVGENGKARTGLHLAGSLTDALQGADVVIVATGHSEFLKLTPAQLQAHGVRFVLDGRNCLDKAKFIESKLLYRGLGR
ncbi:MAG: nucleotide sugar dehydrogenase [Patescibacteria group bacterium]|nr:nucleotide sugar dehydrogenase [Patescibacteria group bacterium]